MTEYWVSREKFYCKYCKIYLADDVPSRTHHDSGFRHKGNYDRFIRDMYKKGERDIKDKAEEAREIARMNSAALAAMQADGIASTSELPITTTTEPSHKKPKPTAASSDPYANYSTAESLGYIDPNAEKLQAWEAELELRKNEGVIGGWEKVTSVKKEKRAAAAATEGEREEEEEKEDKFVATERVGGNFLSVKKDVVGEEEGYDSSAIGIKLKRKRLTLAEEEALKEEQEVKDKLMKKERKEFERTERREAKKTKEGWNEIEVKEEPMIEFDELPKKEEELEYGLEEKVVGGVKQEEEKPLVPAIVAGGGFKKRKMFGASATRKK